MKDITFDEIVQEISRTIEIRYPEVTAQADLFRIYRANGRSANGLYAYVNSLAKDANLESLTPEKIKIRITINALDEKYKRLKEITLEATGHDKEELTDTLFKRLIQEHEHWLANQADDKGTAKAKKVYAKKPGHRPASAKGSKGILFASVVGKRGITKINVSRRTKPTAPSVEAKGILKRLAGRLLHLSRELDQTLRTKAEIRAGV